MTDTGQQFESHAIWAQIVAERAAREALAAEALPANKTALFDALAVGGITSVLVTFDGYGDSGQIEGADGTIDGAPAELPVTEIELRLPTHDGASLDVRQLPLPKAIEELCYELLEQEHPGWEINEGAFGVFRFDVAERSVTLEHSNRSTDYFEHEW